MLAKVMAGVICCLALAGCATNFDYSKNSEILYGTNRGVTDYYVVSGAGSVGTGYLFQDRYRPYNYPYNYPYSYPAYTGYYPY